MTAFNSAFESAILSLDRIASRRVIQEAIQTMSPLDISQFIVTPVLERIGDAWTEGRIALSQIYMCSKISEELIDEIMPTAATNRVSRPIIAIATLQDYHSLGRKLVYSHLRSAGFDLLNYGRMDVQQLVERTVADGTEILLLSTLMYASALQVKDVCERVRAGNPNTKIVVGGAPFIMDRQLWQAVGADAMGANAGSVTGIISKWMEALA